MKICWFIVFFTVSISSLTAQVFDQQTIPKPEESYQFKKVNIDFKAGLAIPVGSFADANTLLSEERVGAALTGIALGAELNVRPTDLVGFGLNIAGTSNPYNTSPYDFYASNDSVFTGVSSQSYLNLKVLGVFSLGVATESLEADFKLMAGPMISRLPEQVLTWNYSGFTLTDTRSKSNSVGLCYGLGFDTRYYLGEFYLKTFADFTSSTVLHDVTYTATGIGRYGGETITTKMNWITMGCGFGIRF